jgi:hypothetical protein
VAINDLDLDDLLGQAREADLASADGCLRLGDVAGQLLGTGHELVDLAARNGWTLGDVDREVERRFAARYLTRAAG